MTRILVPAALIAVFVALTAWETADAPMSDLLATWLAGHFYGIGALDQIYPADTDLFTMLPPSGWEPLMRGLGYPHVIFPFIYPPLWAWVAAPMAAHLSPEGLFAIARVVNPALIGGMIWLAARATRTRLSPGVFVAIGLAGIGLTSIGQIGLEYGQPQILVSFLTVLAVERASRAAPLTGGAVLALAAALKLYPALYAALWVLAWRRRPLLAFAATGGALGLLSIAVAGWPLHAAFLRQVAMISDTVLLTRLNFSLDPVIGQLALFDRFAFVPQGEGQDVGWYITRKGPLWSAVSAMGMGATLLAGGIALRRTGDPLVWPVVMILCSLLTPLSWVYHYLAPMAFAPALLDRLGARTGGIWLIACITPQLLPVQFALANASALAWPVQGVSVLCFLGLAAGFALAIARGKPET